MMAFKYILSTLIFPYILLPNVSILCHGFIIPKSNPITFNNYHSKKNLMIQVKMSIQDEVTSEIKTAMKAKDTLALNTLRGIRAAFVNALKDGTMEGDVLPDSKAVDVLRKMAKMRKEAIDMYEKNNAMDRAENEKAELAIIEKWLPSMASEEQTREWIHEIINKLGKENCNTGKVMGALMKEHKGDLDGALAQKVLKEVMSSL